jgi:thymidylate synthase
LKIHKIDARDLPDLWFQAVHDILDHGNRFTIDRGSYAGQTRLEYDYFVGHVKYPGSQPLIPDIPQVAVFPILSKKAIFMAVRGMTDPMWNI